LTQWFPFPIQKNFGLISIKFRRKDLLSNVFDIEINNISSVDNLISNQNAKENRGKEPDSDRLNRF
jgi:hypothetical protein